jgi:DNA-directed RNA polymerase specialized sigma subunit
LNDLEIADRLGIVRQQVINLRQAARQRLARRLRKEVE